MSPASNPLLNCLSRDLGILVLVCVNGGSN